MVHVSRIYTVVIKGWWKWCRPY